MQTMQAVAQTTTASRKVLWTGWIVGALPSLLLIFSAVMKMAKVPAVVEGFNKVGYPESLLVVLGIVEIFCAVIYLIPRTAVLGAILATGYLGGATATNVRVGDPTFFVPIVCGVLIWFGLLLRDPRLRDLLPLRSVRTRGDADREVES